MNLNLDICFVLRQKISMSYNLLVFVDYIIMISNEAALGQGSLFLFNDLTNRKRPIKKKVSYLQ